MVYVSSIGQAGWAGVFAVVAFIYPIFIMRDGRDTHWYTYSPLNPKNQSSKAYHPWWRKGMNWMMYKMWAFWALMLAFSAIVILSIFLNLVHYIHPTAGVDHGNYPHMPDTLLSLELVFVFLITRVWNFAMILVDRPSKDRGSMDEKEYYFTKNKRLWWLMLFACFIATLAFVILILLAVVFDGSAAVITSIIFAALVFLGTLLGIACTWYATRPENTS